MTGTQETSFARKMLLEIQLGILIDLFNSQDLDEREKFPVVTKSSLTKD